jgi:solute carrier family 25 citrate transporter 1
MGRTKMIEDSKREVPRFKGTAHGMKMIIAEEGYRGIYRGLGPVVRLQVIRVGGANIRC